MEALAIDQAVTAAVRAPHLNVHRHHSLTLLLQGGAIRVLLVLLIMK
jgi:hypothetical protein